MNPRTVLFIHQSFPGQFCELARTLARDGHRVFALALNPARQIPGVTIMRYLPVRKPGESEIPELLQEVDAKIIRAESVYKAMKTLREKGLEPDVIYAHPGWGEAIYLKNIWPGARYVAYAEWFYNKTGQEVNFDPAFPSLTEEEELRLTLKNLPFLQALSECDAAIAPTSWQKSRYPAWAQQKIRVIHDGLNLHELGQVLPRPLRIPAQGLSLRKGMPIVTFCAMHLEPVRGFHYFLQSLPAILAGNRDAHVIVMGQDAGVDNTGYGRNNPEGKSWRRTYRERLGNNVDWSRVHFLGLLERKLYLAMLKLSACHVYLTTPFILSWSFLEAAALGLPIVASDTPPVREFDNLDGIEFVPFADPEILAGAVLNRLAKGTEGFYDRNREAVANLDIRRTIPQIRDILFAGRGAQSYTEGLEEIVFLDEE